MNSGVKLRMKFSWAPFLLCSLLLNVQSPAVFAADTPSSGETLADLPAAEKSEAENSQTPQLRQAPVQPTAVTSNVPAKKTPANVPFHKKFVSFLAGTVVGVPVCMVRRSKYEDWYAVHGMVGDSDNKLARATLGTLWFPFAVVTGVCEAPFDGAINAFRNTDKPFSKDQFSLGELKQNRD